MKPERLLIGTATALITGGLVALLMEERTIATWLWFAAIGLASLPLLAFCVLVIVTAVFGPRKPE